MIYAANQLVAHCSKHAEGAILQIFFLRVHIIFTVNGEGNQQSQRGKQGYVDFVKAGKVLSHEDLRIRDFDYMRM
jgi:hypothetical protein